MSEPMWLPYLTLERRIRALLAERMERGATDELDRKLVATIAQREAVARAGWFS